MATIQFNQASGGVISIEHLVDGQALAQIIAAKYQIFDRTGSAVLTLTLNNGITCSNGIVDINISGDACNALAGIYRHECVVRDAALRDLFILNDSIKFNSTTVRI